ncbi:MAG TPA: 4-alpha-glucanotransferase, partial [Rhizomicrobium sp.]|nr:4-alpha-glucanotransferase [Rhizomicrobium sp.]
MLTALSLPCENPAAIKESLAHLKQETFQPVSVKSGKAFFPEANRLWGISVQLYALRGGTTNGFGDFAALGDFVHQAAPLGADAVAISPVHALFAAAPDHFSPYAPSTRLFLNPLYAPLDRCAGKTKEKLIDWPRASARKWTDLRKSFARFRATENQAAYRVFVQEGGSRLLDHARFEVLDARFRKQGLNHWRNWPLPYRDSRSPAVGVLSPDDNEVAFHLYAQWRADEGLAQAQQDARTAGMAVGLIADMAVGMDPAGSHAWSAPDEVLSGLAIGAPPDLFNARGQNWGLTNFSPLALRRTGFDGFVSTLRSAMRHAGGIRLDHAMGLERIWVIPEGASAGDGVYLHYPRDEMLALLVRESRRHRAMVVAEDLGTVPRGFR